MVHQMRVSSIYCGLEYQLYTSNKIENYRLNVNSGKETPFDISMCSVVAFREVGRGFLSSLQTFSRVFNISDPDTFKTYRT